MLPVRSLSVALFTLLAMVPSAHAGLYYSGEEIAPLPSQWRGFLLDQRLLRTIAYPPTQRTAASPMRLRYQEAVKKLEATQKERALTADEQADLGALQVRLGNATTAVELLRAAQRRHPNHFAIAANLGTAWQLHGDLTQAAAALELAVKLAPGKWQRAEECHLKLVRFRIRRGTRLQLDDLFGARYVGESGKFEPGKLSAAEKKKLPADAAAIVQQLGLWLPADGLLLWQMAELASGFGDLRTGAALMDGCVIEFAVPSAELRAHRQELRKAVDALGPKPAGTSARAQHEEHVAGLAARSKRPLQSRTGTAELPAIDPKGVNPLPWTVIAETTIDKQYRPTFAKYLRELDGKQVQLVGFMQPLSEELDVGSFMFIEYPVGCWYCEAPEVTGIVLVDLPRNKTTKLTRERLKVTGTLKLNDNDPENFLYTIRNAKVVEE